MVACPKCKDKAGLGVQRACTERWTVAAVTVAGIEPETRQDATYGGADVLICAACGWVGDVAGYLLLTGQESKAQDALKAPFLAALDRLAAVVDAPTQADLEAVRAKVAGGAEPKGDLREVGALAEGKVG